LILNKMVKFSDGLLSDETILANLNICAGQTILDAGYRRIPVQFRYFIKNQKN